VRRKASASNLHSTYTNPTRVVVHHSRERLPDYALKVARDPHELPDDEFNCLKRRRSARYREPAVRQPMNMTDFDRQFIKKWRRA